MKRLPLLVLVGMSLLAACGGEKPANPAQTTTERTAPPLRTETPVPVRTVPNAPPAVAGNHSTPAQCAGDGSYAMAVDCFRMSSGFHFEMKDGGERMNGVFARATPGLERVRLTASGTEWTGVTSREGVTWYRNGHAEKHPPAFLDRTYQRLALLLDPQKNETALPSLGAESIGGVSTNHYQFTDANNDSKYEAWVSMNDGNLIRMTLTPAPRFAAITPPMSMTLSQYGKAEPIAEPK